MEKKTGRRVPLMTALLLVVVAASFNLSHPQSVQPPPRSLSVAPSNTVSLSAAFRVKGNVYPLGYYSVVLNIGNPPKPFELDIDTGSDLTWVQCHAPCKACTLPLDRLYKPKNNTVPCSDSLCPAIQPSRTFHCPNPKEQCDYEVQYADAGSSLGVLVTDSIFLRLTNGHVLSNPLGFGCGYDQENPGPHPPPPTAGVLGLGRGKANIVSQLQSQGKMRKVFGHCLSRTGGGVLFFGDFPLPSSRISWTPLSSNPHYSSGPAELLFGGKPTGAKGLQFIFDSGSSYSYFTAQVYQFTLNLIRKNLTRKPLKDAPDDKELAVCWKAAKPIRSTIEVRNYFQPLVLKFTNARNVQLRLMPEDYLIVSKHGNVCLGILNGSEQRLENLNVIGDIFMQDKMVIYDNEKQQIGWYPANCNEIL